MHNNPPPVHEYLKGNLRVIPAFIPCPMLLRSLLLISIICTSQVLHFPCHNHHASTHPIISNCHNAHVAKKASRGHLPLFKTPARSLCTSSPRFKPSDICTPDQVLLQFYAYRVVFAPLLKCTACLGAVTPMLTEVCLCLRRTDLIALL